MQHIPGVSRVSCTAVHAHSTDISDCYREHASAPRFRYRVDVICTAIALASMAWERTSQGTFPRVAMWACAPRSTRGARRFGHLDAPSNLGQRPLLNSASQGHGKSRAPKTSVTSSEKPMSSGVASTLLRSPNVARFTSSRAHKSARLTSQPSSPGSTRVLLQIQSTQSQPQRNRRTTLSFHTCRTRGNAVRDDGGPIGCISTCPSIPPSRCGSATSALLIPRSCSARCISGSAASSAAVRRSPRRLHVRGRWPQK